MPALQRPLTVVFSVTRNGRPKEDKLLAELVKYVDKEDIKAIQCAHSSIPLKHEPAKNAILAATIKMNNKDIMLSEADRKTDWITIAEAPVEMNDAAIIAALSAYGTVIEDSMRRGYVRDHKGLENGTRYVAIVNMQELPDDLEIDGFPVKLYHRETKCTHCSHSGVQSNLIQEGGVFVVAAPVISKTIVKMKLFVICVDKLVI